MGFKQHTLNNGEYLNRLKKLMPVLFARQQGKAEIEEMFYLYNDRLVPRETNENCGGCKTRVLDRLTTHYNELIENEKPVNKEYFINLKALVR